jgi:hypothetical protein
MSRSELLFWAMALVIFVFSGIVVVVTSHNRHSHRGDAESLGTILAPGIRPPALSQLPLR